MNSEITDDDIDQMMKFMDSASAACIERGRTCPFTCPICGAKAHAERAAYNGHLHAQCSGCGMTMME